MKTLIVTLYSSDLPGRQVQALRLSTDGGDRKKLTWMDRVEGEKVAVKAHRESARIVVVGRDLAKVFEFREEGTINKAARPKEGVWYDVPTSGSLPPAKITWVSKAKLEAFLK